MFLEDLEFCACEKCELKRDIPLLVGVSGGADSLALMLGLENLGFSLKIAHLDHGLRVNATQDADFIQDIAGKHGLEFIRTRVDVGKVADAEGKSIEEAARYVRYKFLFEQARLCGAQAVAVGHNADDQVETVLMHLLRGSGLPGLTGMSFTKVMPIWDSTIPLVRPLLSIWREDIEAFIKDLGIEARMDHTNQDITYFRNKLRHVLIPELAHYNPRIQAVLWSMADILREENDYLDDLAQKAWRECKVSHNKDYIILHKLEFLAYPKAIQRRLFRHAISLLRPDLRDVGYDAIERGLNFSGETSLQGEFDLVARLNLAITEDYIIIKSWESGLPDWEIPLLGNASREITLDINQVVMLRHGWQVEAKLLTDVPAGKLNLVKELDPNQVWLDFDLLSMPLTVRGRRKGDRWQPLGMVSHTQKLKDFFINKKIPAHVRDRWPLICMGNQIAWVVGLRLSEAFKITQNTERILVLRLIRKVA